METTNDILGQAIVTCGYIDGTIEKAIEVGNACIDHATSFAEFNLVPEDKVLWANALMRRALMLMAEAQDAYGVIENDLMESEALRFSLSRVGEPGLND